MSHSSLDWSSVRRASASASASARLFRYQYPPRREQRTQSAPLRRELKISVDIQRRIWVRQDVAARPTRGLDLRARRGRLLVQRDDRTVRRVASSACRRGKVRRRQPGRARTKDPHGFSTAMRGTISDDTTRDREDHPATERRRWRDHHPGGDSNAVTKRRRHAATSTRPTVPPTTHARSRAIPRRHSLVLVLVLVLALLRLDWLKLYNSGKNALYNGGCRPTMGIGGRERSRSSFFPTTMTLSLSLWQHVARHLTRGARRRDAGGRLVQVAERRSRSRSRTWARQLGARKFKLLQRRRD